VDTKQLMEWSDKHLMFTAKRNPVALVRGEGVRVWDSEGKEYLDFTGGIAVTALGHSHPRVVGTMREQAATLLHVSNLFYIPQQIHLAKLLCDHSFADRVFFSNSGAEANETAIKLARKWAKEHGASDRGDIISMRGGFHGRTLATVTATAQEKYHHGFEPLPGGFKYVPFNDLRAVERAIDADGRHPGGADPGGRLSSRRRLSAGPAQDLRRGGDRPDLRRDPDGHGADGQALGL
jgi:acetylornithine aminotransferase/acetylornithine/N-succinyldiaminopimelate aminotransferase